MAMRYEPGDPPQPGKAEAALIGQVSRLSSRVTILESLVGSVRDQADSLRTGVDLLLDSKTTSKTKPAPARSWLDVTDASQAAAWLTDLATWFDTHLAYYAAHGEDIPTCWPWHPGAVAELLALHDVWIAAYDPLEGKATLRADWHDRYRPSTCKRLHVGQLSLCLHDGHQHEDGTWDHDPTSLPEVAKAWVETRQIGTVGLTRRPR